MLLISTLGMTVTTTVSVLMQVGEDILAAVTTNFVVLFNSLVVGVTALGSSNMFGDQK